MSTRCICHQVHMVILLFHAWVRSNWTFPCTNFPYAYFRVCQRRTNLPIFFMKNFMQWREHFEGILNSFILNKREIILQRYVKTFFHIIEANNYQFVSQPLFFDEVRTLITWICYGTSNVLLIDWLHDWFLTFNAILVALNH